MINFIVWIILRGVLGWIASMIMGTNAQQGTLMNIGVGIVGAFLAGWVRTPLFGIATINQNNFSIPALGGFPARGRHPAGDCQVLPPRLTLLAGLKPATTLISTAV